MNKLLNMIKWDIRFQINNGLYLAGIVMSALWIVVISLFPSESMMYVIPIVLLSDLSTMGMLFIAAILYFERGHGSINAVVVSPLRTNEFIKSKVISLTIYVLAATSLVVVTVSLLQGLRINLIFMILAIVITAVAYILGGFILSTYFKSFTDFLFPMGLVSAFFNLPLLWMFNIEALEAFRKIIYIIPSYGMIILIQSIFTSKPWYDIVYAVVYNSVIIVLLYKLCITNFNRKIIGRSRDIDG